MSEEQATPAEEKLRQELEAQRKENEQLKNTKQPWLDRHLAVVVTALVSLSTLSFSAVQWRVAQANERGAQAERKRLEDQEERRRDEEWKLKGMEFIFSHERYFFGNNPKEFQKAVRILAVGLPERISEPLLKRLELTASAAEKLELKTVQAQMRGEDPPPRPPAPAPSRAQAVPKSRPGVASLRDNGIRENPIVERPRPLEERPAPMPLQERPRPLRNRGR